MWEASVVETFRGKPGGARLDEQHYNWQLFSKNLLSDDIDEIIQDGVVHLYHQITSVTPKSVLEYKCGYKLMPNMNILVGIDERDFLVPKEDDYFPFEGMLDED